MIVATLDTGIVGENHGRNVAGIREPVGRCSGFEGRMWVFISPGLWSQVASTERESPQTP